MKQFLWSLLLCAALLLSCSDDLDMTLVSSATAPQITNTASISDSLTLNREVENETSLELIWSEATYGVNTVVTYLVEMDAPENNFDSAHLLRETTNTQTAFTHSELNAALLTAGFIADESATAMIRISAELGSENSIKTYSEPITINVTPYSDEVVHMSDIGIIGSATPGGWDEDTDMEDLGNGDYRLVIELTEGEAKFRQDNDWTVNWGAEDFPTGVGTQDGPNIKVVAGKYEVNFNKNTGAYSFVPATDFPSIGIIGDATPGGWDEDTDLFSADGVTYTLEVELLGGKFAKFRQDDDWAINWGAEDFPSGTATQDGANIPISADGTYNVTFNRETGEYNFEVQSEQILVGIIGDATPGGWDVDTDMTEVESGVYELTLDLVVGEVKFRANDDWTLSWGGTEFPSGTAVEGGDNIMVTAEGSYKVTLDLNNLTYNFEEQLIQSVGIIGDATPGGWDMDTDMEEVESGVYEINLELTEGQVKFRANDDWTLNWGGSEFPSGMAIEGGDNIQVVPGEYTITLNLNDLTYNFAQGGAIQSVGIIGDATPGGWDADTDMQDIGDGVYSLLIGLGEGQVKFRANDNWDLSWGATDFPDGIGSTEPGSPNIEVTPGLYTVTFNSQTGAYSFKDASIGLIGSATPGGWDADTNMVFNVEVPNELTLDIDLTEGEAKFRANDNWDLSWGAEEFPNGTGSSAPGSPNIPVAAGRYHVVFNVLTAEYRFEN